MYSENRILERLVHAKKSLGWIPERHSIEEVDKFTQSIKHLEYYRNNILFVNSDALTPMQNDFIDNEVYMCSCDADYWITRYAFLRDDENVIHRFSWLPSQKVAFKIIGEMEARRSSIEIQWLKGRQLGVSTIIELLLAHKILFGYGVNAVAASIDEQKGAKMAEMMFLAVDRCPWWLKPTEKQRKLGKYLSFFNECSVSVQSGKQLSGIARGTTPTAVHLSEVADYQNPKELIDASLFHAVHPSPKVFMHLESTGNSNVGWWADTWRYNKANWHKGSARLRPIFLPWFMGTNIYPTATWLRDHKVPDGWVPVSETQAMIARCNAFVKNTDYLTQELGHDWKLPRSQAWYWESNYMERKAKRTEKLFLQELPCVTGDTRISTDLGIVRIDKAENASITESGQIKAYLPRGEKPILRMETADGRILDATEEHLIRLADDSWCQMSNLKSGDSIKLSRPMFAADIYTEKWNWLPMCDMQVKVDANVGRFLGYFMGDGCFHSGSIEIAIDAKDEDTRLDVHRLIELLMGRKSPEQKVGQMYRIRAHNIKWLEILQNMGCVEPAMHKNLGRQCGYKRKICVPEAIFRSPKHVIKEFISALFECDGHAAKDAPRVSLYSRYDHLLRDVQLLLLGFGIRSKFMAPQKKNGNGRTYIGRELSIPAAHANAFYDQIGFISQRKHQSGMRRTLYKDGRGKMFTDLLDQVKSVAKRPASQFVYDISTTSQTFSANGIEVHNCDDYEALQSKQEKVFPYEVLNRIEDQRQKKYEAFAIVGEGIEEKFHPIDTDVDYEKLRIPITWSYRDKSFRWQLIPLKTDGIEEEEARKWNNVLLVFERPKEGSRYSAAADTASGGGQDRTVVSMTRVEERQLPDVQVAELCSDQINAAEATYFVMALVAWYFPYKFAAEQIRKPGDICQVQMRLMGWPNSRVHHMIRYDGKRIQKNKAIKLGWYTSSWSRPLLFTYFIAAIENGWYIVNSKFLQMECDNLEAASSDSGKTKMGHMQDKHDDRWFAAAISYFIAHDVDLMIERSKRRYTPPESKLPELVSEPCVLNIIRFEQIFGKRYPGKEIRL